MAAFVSEEALVYRSGKGERGRGRRGRCGERAKAQVPFCPAPSSSSCPRKIKMKEESKVHGEGGNTPSRFNPRSRLRRRRGHEPRRRRCTRRQHQGRAWGAPGLGRDEHGGRATAPDVAPWLCPVRAAGGAAPSRPPRSARHPARPQAWIRPIRAAGFAAACRPSRPARLRGPHGDRGESAAAAAA